MSNTNKPEKNITITLNTVEAKLIREALADKYAAFYKELEGVRAKERFCKIAQWDEGLKEVAEIAPTLSNLVEATGVLGLKIENALK